MTYFVYFFPILFVGMWFLVLYIISKMGWADLEAKYQTRDPFIGNRIGIISVSINGMNYNNSIILKYNEEGIYLNPVFIIRIFHKPILIPWKEIIEVRDKKILFLDLKELIIGNPFVAKLMMRKSTFTKIETPFILHN